MKFEYERHGIGTGTAIVAVVVVILIAGAGYFIVVPGSSSSTNTTTTSSLLTTTTSTTTTTSATSITSTTSATSAASTTSTASASSTSTASTSSSSQTTTTSSAATATVVIPQGAGSGQNFSPSTISVAPGTVVTFIDQDSLAPHNVWFTSVPSGATNPNNADGQSNGYEILKGQSVSYTLTTPGTYTFLCQFHTSWMMGTITVTS